MKSKKALVLVFLVLLIVTMGGPQDVKAKPTWTEYTATETQTEVIYSGDWDFLPSDRVHFRGQVTTNDEIATDLRASGSSTLVSNGNLDPTGTGPIWGTIVIEVPDSDVCKEGGVWIATWTGKMSFSQRYVYWSGVMHGVSGCVEGLKVKFESNDCVPGEPCSYSGKLLDPHGE